MSVQDVSQISLNLVIPFSPPSLFYFADLYKGEPGACGILHVQQEQQQMHLAWGITVTMFRCCRMVRVDHNSMIVPFFSNVAPDTLGSLSLVAA